MQGIYFNTVKKYAICISVILGSLFLWLPIYAQITNPEINFGNIKVHKLKNIPENDVNCLFMDSKGFIWIGTLDGLHRYDGYTYKTYRVSKNSNSITSNMIIAVDEDSHGNIWIGTYGKGICKLDPITETFTSYASAGDDSPNQVTNDITCLLVDNKDYLWIGNPFGAYRVKLDSNLSTVKMVDSFSLSFEDRESGINVKNIFQDKDGNIWIGTNQNVLRIIDPHNTQNKIQFETFSDCPGESLYSFNDSILSAGFRINVIYKDNITNKFQTSPYINIQTLKTIYHKNHIWVGTRNGIICLQKNSDETWSTVKTLSAGNTDTDLSSNIVTSMITDNLDQIWVGTRGGGVNIISLSSQNFQHYNHTSNPGSVGNNLIRSIFEDSRQNLWIGTEENGASMLARNGSYTNDFKQFVANQFLSENRVYAIEETFLPGTNKSKSIIWMGTSYPKNLTAFNAQTHKEIQLPTDITNDLGFIFSLEAENDTTLWAGSYNNGLWRLTLSDKGSIIKVQNFTPDSTDNFLSHIIRSIYKDSKGNLWIGTDKGLNRIKHENLSKADPLFEAYAEGKTNKHLSHDYILQVVESTDGKIWIGTMGGGLICYEETNNGGDYQFKTYTIEDGLPNNSIKSIVEDDEGNLWLTSNKGITRFSPPSGSVNNYDIDDGLQANEFSEICAIKRKNGDIIAGGINGFNVFNPKNIKRDSSKPDLYFTNFLILNKEINPGDKLKKRVILEKSIEYTKNIELEYSQNSFSIGFVGLHFNAPQKNNYRYMLEGFDEQWYKASPEYRLAKYTNIRDGEYKFKVMGSNCDNVWTDEPITLNIKINPPFFRSTQAFALYFFIILMIAGFLIYVSRVITKRKQELFFANVEKNKIEEISKAKLQFFTNISHEFRTPLTLISAPLNELIKNGSKMTAGERSYNQNLIKHNVNLMLRLVNQLLDFRKLDQNKLELKPQKHHLNAFLQQIFNAFNPLAIQKRIHYNFVGIEEEDDIWFDAEKIEKVVYNLLSNAFKFTNNEGSIVLSAIRNEDNTYTISVKDSGIGIENEEGEHVFERYYQSKNKKAQNKGGTGIGLALAKGIVELHGGEIWFKNNAPYDGTTFYIKLPVNKTYAEDSTEVETIEPSTIDVDIDVNIDTPTTTSEIESASKSSLILIVEDNYELRMHLVHIFGNDYKIIDAEDGVAGLEKCKTSMPDLIISDVMMPNMDGIEMCKQIKNNEETSHIPVLLLTAKNTEETQISGFETGADSYLPKPFNTDVLKASVKSLLRNREQLKQKFQKEIEINPMIISNTPADTRFLDKILALIEKHLSDSEYSVEKLAEDYGVSRIYLNRKIKALTGETSNQFIRNIRLKHAAELLKQNVLTVSEVTWQVGYNDLRTFRTRFKEKFGLSPSEFAKQHNDKE